MERRRREKEKEKDKRCTKGLSYKIIVVIVVDTNLERPGESS